ncbi:hypothetical protein D3C84_754640 [compost metagenome]
MKYVATPEPAANTATINTIIQSFAEGTPPTIRSICIQANTVVESNISAAIPGATNTLNTFSVSGTPCALNQQITEQLTNPIRKIMAMAPIPVIRPYNTSLGISHNAAGIMAKLRKIETAIEAA